jgi:uncharacterized protein (DUF58 family)
MLLTRRTLFLLLLAVPLVGASALAPSLLAVAMGYGALVLLMLLADRLVSPSPADFELARESDSKLSLGAWNPVTVTLCNQSRYAVRLAVRDEPPAVFAADARVLEGDVAPHGTLTLSYRVRPPRRGDYAFGSLNLRYRGVLGLIIRQARYPAPARVKVYPNLLDIRKYEILMRKAQLYELGLRNARIFGAGTEFERLRDYQPDDEYRKIHWKATARRGKPITMEYETERSQTIVTLIDVGRMMRSPVGDLAKVDYAINTALMLAYVAGLKGDRIGLLTFADQVGGYLAPRRGKGQFYRMLETLYAVQSQPAAPNYQRAFGYLAAKNKKRSLVVVFTDLGDADAARELVTYVAQLWPRHLPLCVTISDPALTGVAGAPAHDSAGVYQRAVAEKLLNARQVVLETLARHGVLTLDVPAEKLTVAVINKYLELKARTLL